MSPTTAPSSLTIDARLALAERTVPRYTSYPTAPHFNGSIDAGTYARWLGELDPAVTLSIYLHVPFCAAMCAYCGCHTKVVHRSEPIHAYRARLVREIGLVAGKTQARHVRQIHWGGGTPTMLTTYGMAAVIGEIAARFACDGDIEHAVELDPRHTGLDVVAALARLGVTRASLGVQDLNPHVQEAIGRLQPLEIVTGVVDRLRVAGIARISMDLMYGLPRQSTDDVRRTIEQVLTLAPERIALFGYAHVPWFKSHQRLITDGDLPDAAERIMQAEAARATLVAAGYVAVGLDHFALPGDALAVALADRRLRRNFQGYTDDPADVLLGLGASSIGRLPQGYVQNAVDFGGYHRAVDSGELATARGYAMTADDRLRAAVIERIMCFGEVDLAALAHAHGVDSSSLISDMARLGPLERGGMVHCKGSSVHVAAAGRPYLRLVAAAFDAHLDRAPSSPARHTRAV